MFSTFGVIAFIAIPGALINQKINEGLMWSGIIFIFLVIGMIVLCYLLLPSLSHFLVDLYVFVATYIFCSKTPKKHHLVVTKNLAAHRAKNTKTGIMTLTTTMFIIFVNSFANHTSQLMMANMKNFVGGDIAIIIPVSMLGIDKLPLTKQQKEYRNKTGLEIMRKGLDVFDQTALKRFLHGRGNASGEVRDYEFTSF
jgi:hypothetical protein